MSAPSSISMHVFVNEAQDKAHGRTGRDATRLKTVLIGPVRGPESPTRHPQKHKTENDR